MQRCISGELLDGRPLMFDEAFSEEMERSKRVKLQEAGVVEPLSSRDPNRMSVACAITSTTKERNIEPMRISAATSNGNIKEPMQIDNDPNFSMIEIPTDVPQASKPNVNSKTFEDPEVEYWNRKENFLALVKHIDKFMRKPTREPAQDDQELDFWNSKEIFSALTQAMARYDRTVTNVTNISGHQFSNLTNCHITFNMSSSEVASTLEKLNSIEHTGIAAIEK